LVARPSSRPPGKVTRDVAAARMPIPRIPRKTVVLMPLLDPAAGTLLFIDLQARLMPAIAGREELLANARRLRDAALMLSVPLLYTEQNPKGLGATVPEVASNAAPVVRKMTFDASRAADFPAPPRERPQMVVVGCE